MFIHYHISLDVCVECARVFFCVCVASMKMHYTYVCNGTRERVLCVTIFPKPRDLRKGGKIWCAWALSYFAGSIYMCARVRQSTFFFVGRFSTQPLRIYTYIYSPNQTYPFPPPANRPPPAPAPPSPVCLPFFVALAVPFERELDRISFRARHST